MTDPRRILKTCEAWRDLLGRRQVANQGHPVHTGRGREHVHTILATDGDLDDLATMLDQVAKCLEVPGRRLDEQ